MTDFSDQSKVIVEDPAQTVRQFAVGAGPQWVSIGQDGDFVRIEGNLSDRSGHTKSNERLLTKQAYFPDTYTTVYETVSPADQIGDMVFGPGLNQPGGELIWVVKSRDGGYRLLN